MYGIMICRTLTKASFETAKDMGREQQSKGQHATPGDSYVGQWTDDARHGAEVFTYGASGKVLKGYCDDLCRLTLLPTD